MSEMQYNEYNTSITAKLREGFVILVILRYTMLYSHFTRTLFVILYFTLLSRSRGSKTGEIPVKCR